MSESICGSIATWLGERFECLQTPKGHVRVRTPFMYPDGGLVDVYVQERGGRIEVTDFGDALGWLRQQTAAMRRTQKQERLVQDVCLTTGVELFRGQLVARCRDREAIPDGVMRVSQAVIRIGDIWFTTRTRAIESVSDEVADLLDDRRIAYERGVKLPGRSGRSWTVDFKTRTPEKSTLVSVLSSGSRATAKRVAEHVVATWFDLASLKVGPEALRFVSLFDDTNDVWAEEDFRLVEGLSDIARWSRPDEFAEMISAA